MTIETAGAKRNMYKDFVTTQEEAICHLFFHCCLKDEVFDEPELVKVSEKIVALNLQSIVNVKEEVVHYTSYKSTITDETSYLLFLKSLINPVNDLALYSYCIELMLSDASLNTSEDSLTEKLAEVLEIDQEQRKTIKKLMAQRKVVESDKIL